MRWLRRIPALAWLLVVGLLVAPVYLAYFYRVLSAAGVVGCAMPLVSQ